MAPNSLPRKILHRILAWFWLRRGMAHTSFMGPYRGLAFNYVPQMRSHHMLVVYYDAIEPEVTAWLADNIKPGMSILTAGGYTGVHVLYLARLLQGSGRVDVFEGWPENYAVMTDHLELNRSQINLDVVHPHPICLAETSGTVEMAMEAAHGTHHIAADADLSATTREIPAISADEFWGSGDNCPDVLLLDVEGWELPILRGGTAMLAACHPTLIIEHHKVEETSSWLRDIGYQLAPLGERHFVGVYGHGGPTLTG